MRVEQAIFGELRGGHALKEATGDRVAAAELASRLDLPDTAPPGVDWSPFISGFAIADRYIVARTFLDPEAPRAGMVLSHALVVPLEELVRSSDLRPLFTRLITAAKQPQRLVGFDIDIGGDPLPQTPELVGTAEALTTSGTGPVVWIGLQGFDGLVMALWSRLWPSIRRTFGFRLSFGPSDVVEHPSPTLVCTPAALATRWHGCRIVDPAGRDPATLSAALVAGGEQASSLKEYADAVGADLTAFKDLRLLEEAYRLAELDPDGFDHATAVVRLIDKLSPDPAKGMAGKSRILDALRTEVPSADAHSILTLRNLDLHGFSRSEVFWADVRHWAAASAYPPEQDSAVVTMIEAAVEGSTAIPPWRESITEGLKAAAGRPDGVFASAYWRWAEIKPSILIAIAGAVDIDRELETRTVDAAPPVIRDEVAQSALLLAGERHLPELHGVAVSALYPPAEAARAQLIVEGENRSERGLALALRSARPEEIVSCALEISDRQLVDLAGTAVARTPSLLGSLDMRLAPSQEIWAAGLVRNPEAWSGPKEPVDAVGQVLSNLLDGGPVIATLLEALARTPLADLAAFARRAEVWEKLNGEQKRLFLDATGNAWIGKACAGDVPFAPDRQLESAIVQSRRLSDALDAHAAGDFARGLRLIAALPTFSEQRFLTWLQIVLGRTRYIPAGEAEALGRLVLDRRWKRVVDDLAHRLRRSRKDVRPALRICTSMLSSFTTWMLDLVSLTRSEKWASFEDLAAQLYPSGPDHNALWERSGGSDADLPQNGNGRSRWRDTLRDMQNGGGRVRANELLHAMRNDYPMNEQLQFLASDAEFKGRG